MILELFQKSIGGFLNALPGWHVQADSQGALNLEALTLRGAACVYMLSCDLTLGCGTHDPLRYQPPLVAVNKPLHVYRVAKRADFTGFV